MASILHDIETNQSMTPLKKREVWRSIRESKFVIFLGILVAADTSVIFGIYRNLIKGPIFAARTLIYAKMTQDGMKRGNDAIRKGNILKLYDEVTNEITKLQHMLAYAQEYESIDI